MCLEEYWGVGPKTSTQLEAAGLDVIEAVQSEEIHSSEEFREAFISYVGSETAIPATHV